MPQSFLGENGNYLKRLFLSQIKKIIDKIVACYGVKTMNIKQIPRVLLWHTGDLSLCIVTKFLNIKFPKFWYKEHCAAFLKSPLKNCGIYAAVLFFRFSILQLFRLKN